MPDLAMYLTGYAIFFMMLGMVVGHYLSFREVQNLTLDLSEAEKEIRLLEEERPFSGNWP